MNTRLSFLPRIIGAVAVILLVACGRPPVPRPTVVYPPECEISPGPTQDKKTITVALLEPVRPKHAPAARNASERLLFGLLYETLITIDCLGQWHAGLANTVGQENGGRCWTFELREGARFWDGSPVTARDVAESWLDAAVAPQTRNAGIDSAVTDGDRVLKVYFERPHKVIPRMFSTDAFAVTKPSRESFWPLGSGLYRIHTARPGVSLSSRPYITAGPVHDRKLPVIHFLETSKSGARDLLEGEIDLLVTADPAVIEYAENRPHYVTKPLPWNKTYVLLSTSRVRELRRGRKLGEVSPDLAIALARDAVREDARGYQTPYWWDDLGDCDELTDTLAELPPVSRDAYSFFASRRILYQQDDEVARDLAERLVALAATGAPSLIAAVPGLAGVKDGPNTEGVSKTDMARSLEGGDDFAYVVAVNRKPPDPCYEARSLIDRAPWLAASEKGLGKALIPLVDTRMHLIAKPGTAVLWIDCCGNVVFANGMSQEKR